MFNRRCLFEWSLSPVEAPSPADREVFLDFDPVSDTDEVPEEPCLAHDRRFAQPPRESGR